MSKPALGRGLGALLGGSPAIAKPAPVTPSPVITESTNTTHTAVPATTPHAVIPPPAAVSRDLVRRVPVGQVKPCAFQPRKDFPPETLRELADSIKEQGIVQPLIVRPQGSNFELIAGERRWRAAQLAGLTEVPVIVRDADDRAVLEMALIENLQRENLNPIEEATAYARLSREFNMRQEDIAQRVGKNRATVANAMRLLDLPTQVQSMLSQGAITTGHAKVLLSLKGGTDQEAAASEIVRKGLTVRASEKLIGQILTPAVKKEAPKLRLDIQQAVAAVEQRLTRHFATNVNVTHSDKKGRIEIDYYGVDDLNRLLTTMGLEEESFGE